MQISPPDDSLTLNQTILTGHVLGKTRKYKDGTLVFTLKNARGRFYVRWVSPAWQPRQGNQVLVRGSLFSSICKCKRGHPARIQAAEIILLHSDQGAA